MNILLKIQSPLNLLFFALGLVIVFPDFVLDWISEKRGWRWRWFHVVGLELVAISALALQYYLMLPHYPGLEYSDPLIPLATFAGCRLLCFVIIRFFGLDKW